MVSEDALISELSFKAIRSSGSGGQHVNKVSSKVELAFNLTESSVLSDLQKERLLKKLGNRLTKDHILMLQCDESRSQHKNKELVIKRFLDLIKNGLRVTKKQLSEKKVNRKKPNLE